jgi:septal ring factor EnvC (AmiA/AmiB activator)
LSSELKRTEEALNTAANPADNPQDLQDRIKHTKSDLEIAGNMAQQQQTTETQAEQQLRDEQDKLSAIEGQLDELVRTMGSTAQNSGRNRP